MLNFFESSSFTVARDPPRIQGENSEGCFCKALLILPCSSRVLLFSIRCLCFTVLPFFFFQNASSKPKEEQRQTIGDRPFEKE